MADTGKIIHKDPTKRYFAASAGHFGEHQYDDLRPHEQLARVVKMISGQCTDREKATFMSELPEVMAYADFDGKGTAIVKEIKTAEFLGPGAGTQASTLKGSGLISILGSDAIMEGAMYKVCARQFVPKFGMNSLLQQMSFFTRGVFLKPLGSSADATDIAQDLGMATLNARIFGAKANLGRELLKNASADIKAATMVEIGKDMEMTLNQWVFSHMGYFAGQGANNSGGMGVAVTGADATTVLNGILKAQAKGLDQGFDMDTVLMWPDAHYQVFTQLLPGYNEKAQDVLEAKRPFMYGGLTFYDTAIPGAAYSYPGAAVTGPTFGWTTTGTVPNTNGTGADIGALVFDKSRMGMLGINEEMSYDEFSDPIKYIEVPCVHMLYDYANAYDVNTKRNNADGMVAVYIHS